MRARKIDEVKKLLTPDTNGIIVGWHIEGTDVVKVDDNEMTLKQWEAMPDEYDQFLAVFVKSKNTID